MKKIILSLLVVFASLIVNAQIEKPVTWAFTAKKISAMEYELHMTASMQNKWHIYSQEIKGDGPVPTSINFDKNPLVKLVGNVAELGKVVKEYSKVFSMNLSYFANKVDFVQKITLKSVLNTIAKGKVTFMTCNDEKCLAPTTIPFSIKINAKS